MLYR
jgi:hypothetical protein